MFYQSIQIVLLTIHCPQIFETFFRNMSVINLPILVFCKYAVDHKLVQAHLIDATNLTINIVTETTTPNILRYLTFQRLDDFSASILRQLGTASSKHWYTEDPNHQDKLISLYKLRKQSQLKNSVCIQPSLEKHMIFDNKIHPVACQVDLLRVPSLTRKFNRYRLLIIRNNLTHDVTTEEFEEALTVHPEDYNRHSHPELVLPIGPITTSPCNDENGLINTTLVSLSKEDCVKTLMYGIIFLTKTSIPTCQFDSILVIDRYTSLVKPILLQKAIDYRKDQRGPFVQVTEVNNVVCNDTRFQDLFGLLLEWIHLNLASKEHDNICDDITFRFSLPPTYTMEEKVDLENQFQLLTSRLFQSITSFISCVTILDQLYISVYPFRLDIHKSVSKCSVTASTIPLVDLVPLAPPILESMVSNKIVDKNHYDFYLPQLNTLIDSAIMSKALSSRGMWEHFNASQSASV